MPRYHCVYCQILLKTQEVGTDVPTLQSWSQSTCSLLTGHPAQWSLGPGHSGASLAAGLACYGLLVLDKLLNPPGPRFPAPNARIIAGPAPTGEEEVKQESTHGTGPDVPPPCVPALRGEALCNFSSNLKCFCH